MKKRARRFAGAVTAGSAVVWLMPIGSSSMFAAFCVAFTVYILIDTIQDPEAKE